MDREIRVGAVSYLNTKPLLFGLEHSDLVRDMKLVIDYPSRIASFLQKGEIDLGLVPVAILPELSDSHIYTDYCIGADGPVGSVCIFSEVPLDQVEELFLDYQSRTSVLLARILLQEYWHLRPRLLSAGPDFHREIKGRRAGLVIGDRALHLRQRASYIYDLGEAWKSHTGLPFVFAAWISNRALPGRFIDPFNQANRYGVEYYRDHPDHEVVGGIELHRYFSEFIRYDLDEPKRQGLALFLDKLARLQQLPSTQLSIP